MSAVTPGDAEALVAKVQETLEGLLSKKNLVRDQFLAGNMNPQMYIPILVLLAHEKLANVGATEEAVSAAATASARLGIDDAKTMVRPLLKSKRNVIILRDMPDETTEEEVRAIFPSGPHADKIKTVKAEVNNAWFVKFDLDEGTQDVVLWLRSQKFKGQTVNASIKSEHFLRSFFPLHQAGGGQGPPQMGGFPPPMFMGPEGMDLGMMGFPPPDFEAMMKGKGKGMMMGDMPPLPMGYWQPWGKRDAQLPPIVLPNLKPAVSSEDKAGDKPKWEKKPWPADGEKKPWEPWEKKPWDDSWEWPEQSKGGWKGGGGWAEREEKGGEKGWGGGKGKGGGAGGGKSKGKGEKGEKGEKGAKGGKGASKGEKGEKPAGKGKGKEGGKEGGKDKEGGKAKAKKSEAAAPEEKAKDAKGKKGGAEKPTGTGEKKWKVKEDAGEAKA